MADITFRSAEPRDAEAIAHLHVVVWQQTYSELAPTEAFATLDEAHRRKRWKEKLAAPTDGQLILLAESDGRLVGIGAAGAASEPLFGSRGEIKFLYVDQDFQGRGIGRQLLKRLALHLRERHYPGAALSVVDGNLAAIGFYKALGAKVIGRHIDPGPIWRSENIIMAWDDLGELLR
ncbi:GNAT family N-acetyltransferase [Pleomorphomonas oryzae]|uniref:GNAT family N-acetyltransferase n=1 Tax=Pleomorphomonas oryzae TaxID=261934 RepID=UPI0003F818B6|nr:GNAT family N-acetyltransferase [Pleomorphomonas oryzae]